MPPQTIQQRSIERRSSSRSLTYLPVEKHYFIQNVRVSLIHQLKLAQLDFKDAWNNSSSKVTQSVKTYSSILSSVLIISLKTLEAFSVGVYSSSVFSSTQNECVILCRCIKKVNTHESRLEKFLMPEGSVISRDVTLFILLQYL